MSDPNSGVVITPRGGRLLIRECPHCGATLHHEAWLNSPGNVTARCASCSSEFSPTWVRGEWEQLCERQIEIVYNGYEMCGSRPTSPVIIDRGTYHFCEKCRDATRGDWEDEEVTDGC
jgi:hypothetical protein